MSAQTHVHITRIRAGDTVVHNGQIVTVCVKDIKYSTFMGVTLFGDSYRCGTLPVEKGQCDGRIS